MSKNKPSVNVLSMEKKDFTIVGNKVKANDNLWDKYCGDRITEKQAEVYLEVEEDFAASVLAVAGRLGTKLMKKEDYDKVVIEADLPGDGSKFSATYYKSREFGSKLNKSRTEHYGFSTPSITHGNGEKILHVQDYLANMARAAFENKKK